jgi:hypothetical protein
MVEDAREGPGFGSPATRRAKTVRPRPVFIALLAFVCKRMQKHCAAQAGVIPGNSVDSYAAPTAIRPAGGKGSTGTVKL